VKHGVGEDEEIKGSAEVQGKPSQRNVTADGRREMECRDSRGLDEEYQRGGANEIFSE
jgi:hypothetical protein